MVWVTDASNSALRDLAIRGLLASIAVNALLGVWALLSDEFGSTQGKVLGTSFLVSAAMLSVLVNGAPLSQRVLWPVPAVAAGASAGGFLLFIVLVWADLDDAPWWKVATSGLIIGVGATLAGLLALLSLQRGHEPWRLANDLLIAALCTILVVILWAELNTDWIERLAGVLAVLVAALTLAVPVLSRVSRPDDLIVAGHGVRYCPSCGRPLGPQPTPSSPTGCPRCGFRFTVVPERS